jgi:response regulator RpfG family c-di-GMP phosphodiesterase
MTPEATELAVALSRMQSMSADLQEIKATMKDLANAVARLAVVEERQANTSDSIGRAFTEIKSLGERIAVLEQGQPLNKHSSDMVQTVTKYVVVAVLGALISGLWVRQPSLPAANPPAIVGK